MVFRSRYLPGPNFPPIGGENIAIENFQILAGDFRVPTFYSRQPPVKDIVKKFISISRTVYNSCLLKI